MKNASTAALVGIWMILLTAFVVTILYVGRQLLIPLALAAMLTFLLAPLVGYIERWIGRIAAVLIVVAMLFGVVAGAGWLLTRQLIDLAAKLPNYQTNIDNRLHAIRLPTGGAFGRFSHSVSELQKQMPDSLEPPANATGPVPETKATTEARSRNVPAGQQPMPVRIVESQSRLPQILQTAATGLLGPLGTAWLVFFLVIFMLLKREDLRGRMIRLIGQGRISATTRAMDDAGSRVARYLTMQLLVNVSFGSCIAIGLYFIGVPNAALWGAFAAIMRFVPYVGVWIAAAVPVLLSFAVSTSWLSPLITIGLFVVLELINANALEPWLYGSSTGVSSIALIIAAVFWTWLWGPIGLVLAIPLTVCVAVMGRHVPKLQFLSVLLSEEQALAPHEECYHRLLAFGLDEAHDLAEAYVKTNSLTSLYDSVLIPTVTLAEMDAQRDELDAEHRSAIHRHIHDLIEDLGSSPPSKSQLEADKTVAKHTPFPLSSPTCRVLCVPARAYRDELAGAMLVQLLRQQDFDAENASAALSSDELLEMAHHVASHVADRDAALFGPVLDDLHQLSAALAGELGKHKADDGAVVVGGDAEVAALDRPLDGLDRRLVVRVDHEDTGFGDAEAGDLLDRDLGAVGVDLELVHQRRVGPSGPDAGELAFEVSDRLAHLVLAVVNDKVGHLRVLAAHASLPGPFTWWCSRACRSALRPGPGRCCRAA